MSDGRGNTPMPAGDDLAADRATGDAPRDTGRDVSSFERSAAALHVALTPPHRLPDRVRDSLVREGTGIISARRATGRGPEGGGAAAPPAARGWRWLALPIAAALLAAISASLWYARSRERDANELRVMLADARRQIGENEEVLRRAAARADELARSLAQRDSGLAERDRKLAEAAARGVELGERLAAAAADLQRAQLRIAQLERPVDPAAVAQERRMLLAVPGTLRVEWRPFDLPDQPAEQKQISGDVTWNDELKQGYLRFVGLKVNDPAVEQYQVWVIDERGMEQKVSGGVFNATAQGEVVVPIHPGIQVGRVALFAVTVEKPGGTWVPDLKRRIVVAPRG